MPKTLVRLIRHGVTTWNYDGRAQGQTDIPLAPEGEAQARQAAAFLAQDEWDGLYTSDLLRAKDTAAAIGSQCGLYAISDTQLREQAFGDQEGTTVEERMARWGPQPTRAVPGVETIAALVTRAMRSLERIAIAHPDERILVVTHGALIREVVENIAPQAHQRGMIGNLSFTDLVYENGTWSLAAFAKEEHMTPPPGLEGLALSGSKFIIAHKRLPLWQALINRSLGLKLTTAELREQVAQAVAVETAVLLGTDEPVALVLARADGASVRLDWRLVHGSHAHRPVLAVLEQRLRARYPELG